MKKTDYRSALDKVKCSEDFRRRLTEKLAAEPDTENEYTEVTSHVENAKPRKISRTIAAISACAVLCAGAVAVFRNIAAHHDFTEKCLDLAISYKELGEIIPDNFTDCDITADFGQLVRTSEFDLIYDYIANDNSFKVLNSSAKKRIYSLFHSINWEKSFVEEPFQIESIYKESYGDAVHLSYNGNDMYICRNGFIEFRCPEKSVFAFFFSTNKTNLLEDITKAINGSPSPVEDFSAADIEISYEGENIPLNDTQIHQIQQLLNGYDWVEDTMAIGSMSYYDIKIITNQKTQRLVTNGTLEFYKNYSDGSPACKYVQTQELMDNLKNIIDNGGNPKKFNSYSDCEVKIRYGNGDYITVASEENKKQILNMLNGYEWEYYNAVYDTQMNNPFVLMVSENGEEHRYFINPDINIEYRCGEASCAYVLTKEFVNQILSVYLEESGDDIPGNIADMNPTYMGELLTDYQTEKLQDILSQCAPYNENNDVSFSQRAALKLGSDYIYLIFYENGFVSYVTPHSSSLYTLDETAAKESVKIITSDFDYTAKFRKYLSIMTISPYTSIAFENMPMVYVTDDRQYTSETIPFSMPYSEASKLWTILSEAECEKVKDNEFDYKEFYTIEDIIINSAGYIRVSVDDYSVFTVKMSEEDTAAVNAVLEECRQNIQ